MPDPQVEIDTIKEIADMFIEAGIHMDAVNIEGLTAAQICTSRKHQSISRFFSIFLQIIYMCLWVGRFFLFFSRIYSVHPSAVEAI